MDYQLLEQFTLFFFKWVFVPLVGLYTLASLVFFLYLLVTGKMKEGGKKTDR